MPRRIIGCVQNTVEKQNNAAPKAENFWLKAAFFFAVLPVYPIRLIRKTLINRRNKGINVSEYVKIGGVKQFLRIRGKDLSRPLLIFLHGGPALPVRGMDGAFMRRLESEFICVQWDQRGSGRSEGTGEDLQTLLCDLDEVVNFALRLTGKQKARIAGHCWGSVIGLKYAALHPEKIEGYIGICQFVSGRRSYSRIKKIAVEAAAAKGNFSDAAEINKRFSGLLSARNTCEMSVDDWTKIHFLYEKYCGYDGGKSNFSLIFGALCSPDFSSSDFLYLLSWANVKGSMKTHRKIMDECIYNVDFLADPPKLRVPVRFIEAGRDAVTDSGLALSLLARINAADKRAYLVKKCGHNAMFDSPRLLARAVINAARDPSVQKEVKPRREPTKITL